MTVNTCGVDRVFRVMFGLVLLAMTIVGPQSLWGLLGMVPLATGLVGFCPLYRLFGLSTCPIKPAEVHR